MAYYSLAMPAYALITIAGTAVFPAVVALMIAPSARAGENERSGPYFADSLLALVLPGAALGMLTRPAGLSDRVLEQPVRRRLALVGIAPLFLLSVAAAAFRGYFLGTAGGNGSYALSVLVQADRQSAAMPVAGRAGQGRIRRAWRNGPVSESASPRPFPAGPGGSFAANRRSQKKQAGRRAGKSAPDRLGAELWRNRA
jgi:hypothetical protein